MPVKRLKRTVKSTENNAYGLTLFYYSVVYLIGFSSTLTWQALCSTATVFFLVFLKQTNVLIYGLFENNNLLTLKNLKV